LGYPDVIIWGADHYASRLPDGRFLAWDKLDGLESFDSFSDVEFAWWNRKGASRIYRHLWKGICQASEKEHLRHHPTQKPIDLMSWCVGLLNDPKVVCDPYMGSGTTLVAAKRRGCTAIGIELEERYCEIAAKRLAQGVLDFA
jgi:site-specific DNA-methyltransferase (adenine-specific)